MVHRDDIARLVSAYKRVQEALDLGQGNPLNPFKPAPGRRAAQTLCQELGWLSHENGSYWEGLQEASSRLSKHRVSESEFFGCIGRLLEQEEAVFKKLGIDETTNSDILGHAYSALRIVGEYDDPSRDAIANLHDRLKQVTDLVCQASRGPLRRVSDKLIGYKGALMLAGATVGGANVAIAIIDQGALSWASLKAGYLIMKGEVGDLLDILKNGGNDLMV